MNQTKRITKALKHTNTHTPKMKEKKLQLANEVQELEHEPAARAKVAIKVCALHDQTAL